MKKTNRLPDCTGRTPKACDRLDEGHGLKFTNPQLRSRSSEIVLKLPVEFSLAKSLFSHKVGSGGQHQEVRLEMKYRTNPFVTSPTLRVLREGKIKHPLP